MILFRMCESQFKYFEYFECCHFENEKKSKLLIINIRSNVKKFYSIF